nr:aldolase/citrate lyase family protein [Streptomyces sabulosicollis]
MEDGGRTAGQAVDADARGVIVPMVNTAEEAAAAVSSCRYPRSGRAPTARCARACASGPPRPIPTGRWPAS